jgi:hypothetical protein
MPVVKAALVIAKDEEGQNVYLYEGAHVPSSIPADEVARLSEFLSEGEDKPERKPRAKSTDDNNK